MKRDGEDDPGVLGPGAVEVEQPVPDGAGIAGRHAIAAVGAGKPGLAVPDIAGMQGIVLAMRLAVHA